MTPRQRQARAQLLRRLIALQSTRQYLLRLGYRHGKEHDDLARDLNRVNGEITALSRAIQEGDDGGDYLLAKLSMETP